MSEWLTLAAAALLLPMPALNTLSRGLRVGAFDYRLGYVAGWIRAHV